MHIGKTTYQILLAAPKIHTNLLWDLTFLFLILGGLYFLFIFFFRNKLSKLALGARKKRQELAPVISNFLFHSPEDPKDEQKEYVELKIKIRSYLEDRRFRKVIADILFDLQKDVAGGTRLRLFKLFKELELHHDSFKKLESWRWETVAQGILELSQMEVEESQQLIQKFINDRRGVVRKQAELAIVGLHEKGIAFLLDTTRHSISEWQQLKLIEILGRIDNYRPPQFKGWLLSQNKDVVLFALRLIKHYNQKGAEASITELVKHKNNEIKIAAIQCIVDFNFKSALPVLKKTFWDSSNLVKISVLNAIATLGSHFDILFLEEVAQKEKSYIVVGKAQSAINTIAPESILPSKDIVTLDTSDIKKNLDSVENEEKEEPIPIESIDVHFEEVFPPEPTSIEVEEIECYDEVELPKQKNKREERPSIEPEFELSPIEDEYEGSFSRALGFVSSDEETEQPLDQIASFQNLSLDDKSEMLVNLEKSNEKEDKLLLEHVTENESDSELRFMAFKSLQSIQTREESTEEHTESMASELPPEQQSIFYPLFQHAADLDSKLILLKELLAVGDSKELPFLQSLLEHEEEAIVKAAKKGVKILKERKPNIGKDCFSVTAVNETKEYPEPVVDTEAPTDFSEKESEEKIPLELLFLYEELGIKSARENDEEPKLFDFELAPDFFIQTQKQTNGLNSDE